MLNGNKLIDRQNELAVKAGQGDRRALADLFVAMQPYVIRVRQRYASTKLDREDVDQACRLGILRGLKGFDPSKGNISGKCSFWMREEIRKLSDNTLRPVRLPQSRPLKKIQWDALPLIQKLMASGIDEEEACVIAAEEVGVDIEELRQFFASMSTVQIGARQDDEGRSQGEVYEPSDNPDPLRSVQQSDREEALRIVRFSVSEKDWDVLTGRLFRDETFEAIGARYGVSKERARHLLRDAIARAALALEEEGLGPEALL